MQIDERIVSALILLGLKRADIELLAVRDWQAYRDAIDEHKREASRNG